MRKNVGQKITHATLHLTEDCNLRCDYCNPAGTPILMWDLSYKPIEEVRVGDEVVGFVTPDEKGKHTRMVKSVVVATNSRESDLVEVKTTEGSFSCTPDHKWFNGRHYVPAVKGLQIPFVSTPVYWTISDDYRRGYIHGAMAGDGSFAKGEHLYKSGVHKGTVGKYNHFRIALADEEPIKRIVQYAEELGWEKAHEYNHEGKLFGLRSGKKELFELFQGSPSEDTSLEYVKGWIAGLFDTDGCYNGTVRITQMPGPILDSAMYCLDRLGFQYTVEDYKKNGCIALRLDGGFREHVRFFATVNTAVKRKKAHVLENKAFYGKSEVLDVVPSGFGTVYSLQTSTGNYIAHGHASKNCFVSKNPKRCTLEVGKAAIDFLCDPVISGDAQQVHLQFFGGEPFMEFELMKQIVEYAKTKDKKVKFGVTTNATLFTPERLEFIKEHKIEVLFSIDGAKKSQDIHRKTVAGKSSWPAIEKHMKDMIAIQPQITARLTYTPKTLPYLYENVVYLVDEVGFSGCAPSCAYDSYIPFTEEDWEEWDRQYELLAQRYIRKVKEEGAGGDHYIDKCLRQMVNGQKLQSPCGAGKAFVGISPTGTLHPCHRFVQWPEWEIGNVWEGITNEKKRQITQGFDVFKARPECADCRNGFCGGTCLAANYENNGSIWVPSKDGCIVSMKQWQVAERIYEELKDHDYVKRMQGQGLEGRPVPAQVNRQTPQGFVQKQANGMQSPQGRPLNIGDIMREVQRGNALLESIARVLIESCHE